MIDMLKRHEIQVLRRAEHTWHEIAALSGVFEKTARRIAGENPVTTVDNAAERARRQVGRPIVVSRTHVLTQIQPTDLDRAGCTLVCARQR